MDIKKRIENSWIEAHHTLVLAQKPLTIWAFVLSEYGIQPSSDVTCSKTWLVNIFAIFKVCACYHCSSYSEWHSSFINKMHSIEEHLQTSSSGKERILCMYLHVQIVYLSCTKLVPNVYYTCILYVFIVYPSGTKRVLCIFLGIYILCVPVTC